MGMRLKHKLFCHVGLFVSFFLLLFALQKYQAVLVVESAISYQLFTELSLTLFPLLWYFENVNYFKLKFETYCCSHNWLFVH